MSHQGITLYCLLRGRLPFEAENPLDLYEAIRDDPYVLRLPTVRHADDEV